MEAHLENLSLCSTYFNGGVHMPEPPKYIAGRWQRAEGRGSRYLCKKPCPAPEKVWVFSGALYLDGKCLPVDETLCIAQVIPSVTPYWTARIVDSFSRILESLLKSLRNTTWEKDEEGLACVAGGVLSTDYGPFEVCYYQERQQERREPSSIRFIPLEGAKYKEALDCFLEELVCRDEKEILRVKKTLSLL